MKITKNVLNDLLPAYLSGDASSDTRELIEEFAKGNPEFARIVDMERTAMIDPGQMLQGARPGLRPDHELQTLQRTKKMLERRKWCLGMALMFSGFPFAFVFDGGGLKFLLFRDQPITAAICSGLAALFWALYFRAKNQTRMTGL